MKKTVLYLTFFVFALAPLNVALACLNEYYEKGDISIPYGYLEPKTYLKAFKESMEKTPAHLFEQRFKNVESHAHDHEGHDHDKKDELTQAHREAIKELLTGDKAKAVDLLLEIEREHPGQYPTASNLGTAYELNGKNEEALEWIKEGIKRNKESHHGTEWLHALILEAKINLEKNPAYYDNKRVLELPEKIPENNEETFFTYNGQTLSEIEVEAALAYQLQERAVFIKPTDIIVADLLFNLSRIAAHNKHFEPAIEILNLSKEYGFKDQALWIATLLDYQTLWLKALSDYQEEQKAEAYSQFAQKIISNIEKKRFIKETLTPLAQIGFGAFLVALWIRRDRKKPKKTAA